MSDQILVSRQSIQNMLADTRPGFVMHVVGKALVGIYQYQTDQEKATNSTINNNNVGFAGCDGKSGSMTAKFYLKNKRLEDWMVEKWTKPGSNGYARITKYHKQLNTIALNKQSK